MQTRFSVEYGLKGHVTLSKFKKGPCGPVDFRGLGPFIIVYSAPLYRPFRAERQSCVTRHTKTGLLTLRGHGIKCNDIKLGVSSDF